MFGGPKKWENRKVKPRVCTLCGKTYQPKAGGDKYCPECQPEKWRRHNETAKLARREARKARPDHVRKVKAEWDLQRSFGISLSQYNLMYIKQDGLCAICGKPELGGRGVIRKLAVDHDHHTGKNRALLCHRCNTAIGLFFEDEDIMASAISYLREHRDDT